MLGSLGFNVKILTAAHDNRHHADAVCRFLVKVQIDPLLSGTEPHLVYDQQRSFTLFVEQRQQPAYGELFRTVRVKGVMGGIKAYMWCRRVSDTTLRIYLSGMPERTPMW